MNGLNVDINNLQRTSPVTIKRFKALNINTYFDLLNYFPYRFEDYSKIKSIKSLQENDKVTIKGKVIEFKNQYTRRGLTIQKCILENDNSKIDIIWYNQPYLSRIIYKNSLLSVSGVTKKNGYKLTFEPKEFEIISSLNQPLIHTGNLIPVYSEKYGLSSKLVREKMDQVIKKSSEDNIEYLPSEFIRKYNLIDENTAYSKIHKPQDYEDIQKAQERLGFDELFTIQLTSEIIRRKWQKNSFAKSLDFQIHKDKLNTFINQLPFELTISQKKVLAEIFLDLKKPYPMNRLLQGDVGSGKTIIAIIIAYLNKLAGNKTIIMAPTEILATQHYSSFEKNAKNKLKLCLLTKSSKPTKKQLEEFDVLIGTHAIIFNKVDLQKISLVIIDEQHKFGVAQRATLKNKGENCHLLTMTATPIPRTVALTLYRELDVSIIDEMPKNRLPIKTYYVEKNKRQKSYEWISNQIITEKIQVFIVCPLIDESESETMVSVKAAKTEFDNLQKNIFPQFKIELLHGKMKSTEKDKIMEDFKNKKLDILVSTSVVEVGIDIPNATIIIIEGAERFGLAQLHQLRGRVGRGEKQSYCFLFSENENSSLKVKLDFFCKNNDGFKIAEYDLKNRGSGNIFGLKQHGKNELKIAELTNSNMIKKNAEAVLDFLQNYSIEQYPLLKNRLENYKISLISKD